MGSSVPAFYVGSAKVGAVNRWEDDALGSFGLAGILRIKVRSWNLLDLLRLDNSG